MAPFLIFGTVVVARAGRHGGATLRCAVAGAQIRCVTFVYPLVVLAA